MSSRRASKVAASPGKHTSPSALAMTAESAEASEEEHEQEQEERQAPRTSQTIRGALMFVLLVLLTVALSHFTHTLHTQTHARAHQHAHAHAQAQAQAQAHAHAHLPYHPRLCHLAHSSHFNASSTPGALLSRRHQSDHSMQKEPGQSPNVWQQGGSKRRPRQYLEAKRRHSP